MKKILMMLTLLLFATFLEAQTITADYKVEFGIVGEIGIANAVLTKDENTYEIDVELEATGIAATLSGNRRERHVSKGHMENGMLVSDYYQITKWYGSKMSTKLYSIDHKNKTVKRAFKRWKNGKLVKDVTDTLDFYAKDDLLTLYFNLDKKITDKKTPQNYVFKAVGAEKQDGEVEVVIPAQLDEYKELLGESDDSWYARAIIHQNIFSSDKGELLLRVGNDGITQKAVLKDLLFFGDIRAERL
jgi:hypothetical protein